MADRSFIRPNSGTLRTIQRAQRRGFQTAKVVRRTEIISFRKDDDEDGNAVRVPPQTCLVIMEAGRDPREEGTTTESRGELRHEFPFDVAKDYRFTLMPENVVGRIVTEPFLEGVYVRAPFVLEG